VVLVLLNGVFSGAEIAVLSLRRTRLRALVEDGKRSAIAVQNLRDNPERFLATVQVGITVLGATAAAFGGQSLAGHLVPLFETIPFIGGYAGEIAFTLVVGLVSYLSLVLGELVPKSLALRSAESYALLIGRPLLKLSSVARPLVWFLSQSSNLVLRIFGDQTTFTETRLSHEELQSLLEEASKVGTMDPRIADIASRAIDFGELVASDVMVPRRETVALTKTATPDEMTRLLVDEGHSRMPVFEGSIDHVVGYVSARDLLDRTWKRQRFTVEDILRPPFFVPENMTAIALMREMQTRRVHLALVVDEQGVLLGIVTLEDLVEELIGEIFSEHEKLPPQAIRLEPEGTVLVVGDAPVRDVNRMLSLKLPEGEDYTTMAGLVISLTGKIPGPGTRVVLEDGTDLEVTAASARRVKSVRLRPPPRPQASPTEPAM
jgi:putative hemolysin